jgi:hypothetical protein
MPVCAGDAARATKNFSAGHYVIFSLGTRLLKTLQLYECSYFRLINLGETSWGGQTKGGWSVVSRRGDKLQIAN